MASAVEQAFIAAVTTANGVRQGAYAAALAAYAPNGFGVFTNLATYQGAIRAADAAWLVAVNAAASTAAVISPVVVPQLPGMVYGQNATIIT